MSRRGALYGVYDTKDSDICLGIFNIYQIMDFTHKTKGHIYTLACRKTLLKNRYLIEKVDIDNES